MRVVDYSAAEALRRETRALIAESREAVARLRHTREKLASPIGAKGIGLEGPLAESFASLQAAHVRLRSASKGDRGAKSSVPSSILARPRSHRRIPTGKRPPPPVVVHPEANISEPLAAAAALLDLGAPNEAWEVLDQVAAAEQARLEVLAMRARVFHALEMPGMAELVTFAIQAGSPEWARRHFLAAQALARLGLGDRARELARMACALQPDLEFDVLECADLAALLHAEAP